MKRCKSHSDCDEDFQYCEFVYNLCESCSYICQPSRGLKTECDQKCKNYKYKKKVKTKAAGIQVPDITMSSTLPLTVMMATTEQSKKPITSILLIALVVSFLILFILLMLFILITMRLRKKERQQSQATQKSNETGFPLLEINPNISRDTESENVNRTTYHTSHMTLKQQPAITQNNPEQKVNNQIVKPGEKLQTSAKREKQNRLADNMEKTSRKHVQKEERLSVSELEMPDKNSDVSSNGNHQLLIQNDLSNVNQSAPPGNVHECINISIGNITKPSMGACGYDRNSTLQEEPAEPTNSSPSDKPRLPSFETRRNVYELLRRISWIDGYFSSGESIEIYVDMNRVTEEWVINELTAQTNQEPALFHIKDTTEQ